MSRGGRGGRGGAVKSFNKEQLASLGLVNNEVLPGPVTQPPPMYPVLGRKPLPLQSSNETDYLLILKQDFIDHMQLSASYLKMPHDKTQQPEEEIDKLVAQLPSAKEKYNWKYFPTELRPKLFAKRMKVNTPKVVDLEIKLKRLEELEKGGKSKVNETTIEEDEELVEEEQDEEMDDGTDYANNYFDNGEEYDEEDDTLEDGPIF